MTSNIKELREAIINLKSSKYMYIDKSESKNMYRKQYENPRISKSGNSTQ